MVILVCCTSGNGNIAEIVFVLDCSTSIGQLGFRNLTQFVKDVISILDIGRSVFEYIHCNKYLNFNKFQLTASEL
jgi:hypothetical protein